jgi:hypothetical protein
MTATITKKQFEEFRPSAELGINNPNIHIKVWKHHVFIRQGQVYLYCDTLSFRNENKGNALEIARNYYEIWGRQFVIYL